jgi:uncharacterized membrane protein
MTDSLFTPHQQKEIQDAIRMAEQKTSGEIRVHIDSKCYGNVLDRAAQVFAELNMHQTKLRNGVLFYLAWEDRKFAILGDAGIHAVVPDDFWDNIKIKMQLKFRAGQFKEGLCDGIQMAGEQLKEKFPVAEQDVNELSDKISFGKA